MNLAPVMHKVLIPMPASLIDAMLVMRLVLNDDLVAYLSDTENKSLTTKACGREG